MADPLPRVTVVFELAGACTVTSVSGAVQAYVQSVPLSPPTCHPPCTVTAFTSVSFSVYVPADT
jgi:hypothetical protein